MKGKFFAVYTIDDDTPLFIEDSYRKLSEKMGIPADTLRRNVSAGQKLRYNNKWCKIYKIPMGDENE